MIQEKTITIGAGEYRIKQLGAREGRKLYLKVAKVLAEGVRVALSGGDEVANEKLVVDALAGVVDAIDEATLEEMCEIFGKHTAVKVVTDKGTNWPDLIGVVFDQHFAANYGEMTMWLGECVVFNFASFLGVTSLGSAIEKAQAAAASRSASPKTTTGSSSAS